MRRLMQGNVILPSELLVAIFHQFGLEGMEKFDQVKLADLFEAAARKYRGIWKKFGQRRLGSSLLDDVIAILLQGGSLVRDSSLETIYSTPHTLGPYGKICYDHLGQDLRHQVDVFVLEVLI
ncbi:MAG: hypothetical protein AAB455_02055 [Patescibacteria group bacterium]